MNVLVILYYIVLFLTVIKAIVLCRKYSCSAQNYLLFYLMLTLLIELTSRIRIEIFHTLKSGGLYNFYFLLSAAFFAWYYYIQVDKRYRLGIHVVIILTAISMVLFTKLYQLDFDYRLGMILPLFYIAIALLWFYQKIFSNDLLPLFDDPVFWISTALLLWSCFFLFRAVPMYFFEIKDKLFLKNLKIVVFIINIGMYIMINVGLSKYAKQAKAIK